MCSIWNYLTISHVIFSHENYCMTSNFYFAFSKIYLDALICYISWPVFICHVRIMFLWCVMNSTAYTWFDRKYIHSTHCWASSFQRSSYLLTPTSAKDLDLIQNNSTWKDFQDFSRILRLLTVFISTSSRFGGNIFLPLVRDEVLWFHFLSSSFLWCEPFKTCSRQVYRRQKHEAPTAVYGSEVTVRRSC